MKMRNVFSLLIVLFCVLALNITMSFAQESPGYLPEGAIARLGNGVIHEIVYSPDGSQIAVASSIGVWIYNVDTGTEVALLGGGSVTCIAYSPDGKTIAGCGNFAVRRSWGEIIMLDTVRLWDVEEGTIQQTLPYTTAGFSDLVYSPDGTTIAVSAPFDPVRLWDVKKGVFTTTLPEETERPRSIMYSPSGSTIATLDLNQKTIHLWSAEKGTHIKTLAEKAFNMAYSPDGKTIVTGSSFDVHIWDVHTGALKKKWSDYGLGSGAGEVHYSPNGAIVAFSRDAWVSLWDLSKDPQGGPTSKVLDPGSPIINFAYSPDGTTIATATVDLTVRLWDATPEPLGFLIDIPKATLARHTGPVSSVAYSPDGTTIVTGSNHPGPSPFLYFWEAGTSTLKQTVDHTWPVADIAYSPNGDTIATAGGFDGVRLWNAKTGTFIESLNEHGDSPEHRVENIAYSPDGSTLAASINNIVSLWNVSERFVRKTLTGHTLPINSIAYSPDSSTVATGGMDIIVRLWSNANGLLLHELLHELEGHRGSVSSIAYSPDGGTIATAGADYTTEVRLWDTDTRTLKTTLDANGFVNSVAYSPDGNTLATGGADVKLWNAHTGTLEKTFNDPSYIVWRIAYSPDGSVLASASYDGTVLLWDLTPYTTIVPNISDARVKADVNNDGVVNIQDLVSVAANFGLRGQHPADVNGDGTVDIRDIVPNISDARVKADVNNDGVVGNIQDLVSVAANFGLRGQHPADVNGDGTVDIRDVLSDRRCNIRRDGSQCCRLRPSL